jgi:hypothetical protein
METATLNFQKISLGKESRIVIHDIQGKRILGKPDLKNGFLRANILKDFGDRALVLLPNGMRENTAVMDINSICLN